MLITRIEKSKGKQYRIYNEDGYLFSLYGNELKQYGIEEGNDLNESLFSDILDKVIFNRAKERALYLLERQPYSEMGMRRKLISGGTPEIVVNKVTDFLKQYNYIDDVLYVSMYVNSYIKRKSKRQIYNDLMIKGIDRQIMDDYFEGIEDMDAYEKECFEAQYNKYIKGKDLEDPRIRQKVFRYFYGKGFSVRLVEEFMRGASSS